MTSDNSAHRTECKGINGKTCWIPVTNHFTGVKHGDTRISKSPPPQWLAHFLLQCNPRCNDKCVHLDQGGELFDHLEVRNLFEKKGYTMHPTGTDASRQNGPVGQGHQTLANTICAPLLGANLDVKFWPCAFCHSMQMSERFLNQLDSVL